MGGNWFEKLGINLEGVLNISADATQSVSTICNDYKDVFKEELEADKGPSVNILVNNEIELIFLKARRGLYAIRPNLDLEKLEKEGLLTPVRYFKWATPIVPVRKKDNSIFIAFLEIIGPQ